MSGKRRVEISGGRAGYNYVSFTGGKYQTLSQYKDGRIKTETKLNKEDKKITIILSMIPFVRSFSMVIDLLIDYWRRFIVVAIVLMLMELLFIGRSNSIFLYTLPINNLEMLLGLLVIAGLFIKVSETGRYHAAEHMTSNAFDSGISLTLENVRKQPRIHRDCGTNLAVSIVLCFSVLSQILGDSVWLFLLAWAIGFELWKGEPIIIWDLILVIGKVMQYLFFTSKPQDKHLMVAIEAMTRLEEKELKN